MKTINPDKGKRVPGTRGLWEGQVREESGPETGTPAACWRVTGLALQMHCADLCEADVRPEEPWGSARHQGLTCKT